MKKIMMYVCGMMSIAVPAFAGLGDWIREEFFPVRVIIKEVERIVVIPDMNWIPQTPSGWYQAIGVLLLVLIVGKLFENNLPTIKKKEKKEEPTK